MPIALRLPLATLGLSAGLSLVAQTDTTPPSTPAHLAGTAMSSTATVLYWAQPRDNVGIAGYDIYRDGALVATGAENTFSDSGLAPASTHSYRIAARDAAGNASGQSAAFSITTDAADTARLVRPAQFTYLGAFRLPADSQNNYSYGGTAIAFNPANNSLFVRGHDWHQLVGEISIPAPLISTDPNALPAATALQSLTDIAEGHLAEVGADGATLSGCKVGGLLVHQGRLIGTSYVYYDAALNARRSHFTSGLELARTGDFAGMYTVGSVNPGFVAGYMGAIPAEWQTAFGGPALTGQSGLAIITRSSCGPSASVFDPVQLGVTAPVPAKMLVGYPTDHPTLGTWDNVSEPNPQYDMTTDVLGMVFPEATDSVLFFGTAGTGIPGYGAGTSDPALDRQPVPGTNGGTIYVYDPANGNKGCHAFPYTAFVWAYRAHDLARAAAGAAQPWEIVPYATWALPLPFGPAGHAALGGATYDPATNRIFVSQYNATGSRPIIHVYRIEPPPAPPTTYTAWRAANFTGSDLTADAVSGPLADPDAAGLTNLQRYAHNLPARGATPSPTTAGQITANGSAFLSIAFDRRIAATDLSYVVEASNDLAIWTTVAAVPPGTPTRLTIPDSIAIDSTPRRFLRLRITPP